MRPDQYAAFAESYSTENASSLMNAHYERSAVLALAGDMTGRLVLDAGCCSGPLAAELVARSAIVTGIGGSPAMLRLAR